MTALGNVFRSLNIPVDRGCSSEYFFVYQHAQTALGQNAIITRDLAGSPDFSDAHELTQFNQ